MWSDKNQKLLFHVQENKAEHEIRIDPRHHGHFVARRGEILWQIGEDFGGVTVSFPRATSKSDRVVIKGAKDCVDGAVNRINEIVSELVSVFYSNRSSLLLCG